MPKTLPPDAVPAAPSAVLLVFVDGIGLAPPGPGNPLSEGAMPLLESRIGRGLVEGSQGRGDDWLLRAVDATLGVPGLPQSATGQTTLFTGSNAAAFMQRHVAAFPGPRLKSLVDEHSVLKRVAERGGRSMFANAFPRASIAPSRSADGGLRSRSWRPGLRASSCPDWTNWRPVAP